MGTFYYSTQGKYEGELLNGKKMANESFSMQMVIDMKRIGLMMRERVKEPVTIQMEADMKDKF
jgi:hypothetical protein